MNINIEDIKTISIAEDEHLFINIKDNSVTQASMENFRKLLTRHFGHNRVIVVNCDDIEMTKIKYLDTIRKHDVWRI